MRRALLLLPAIALLALMSLSSSANHADLCTNSTTGISICPDVFYRDNDAFSDIHFHPGVQLSGPIWSDPDWTFDGIGWQVERVPRASPILDVNITVWQPLEAIAFTFTGTCPVGCAGYFNLTGLPEEGYEVLVDGELLGQFSTPGGALSFSHEFLAGSHVFVIQQIVGIGGPGAPRILLTLAPVELAGWNTVRLSAAAVLERSGGPVDEELFYRWDLGDGTITTRPDVTHTFAVNWLWAYYPVELRVCNLQEAVCETRNIPLLFFHWPALIAIAAGFIMLLWLLRRRIRYRVVKER